MIDELRKDPMVRAELVDPQTLELPLPGTRAAAEATRHLQQKVKEAASVVLATPEYHGSFSSVMKLVIENLGYPSVLSGKPVALLGVAAGAIGAIKSLEQLRSVCSHIGAIALPLPASVANVQRVFDADGRCLDAGTEKLVRGVATISLTISVGTYARRFSSNAFCGKGWPSVSFTSSRSTRTAASDEHRCTLESLVPGSTAVSLQPPRCVVAPRRWVRYSDTS